MSSLSSVHPFKEHHIYGPYARRQNSLKCKLYFSSEVKSAHYGISLNRRPEPCINLMLAFTTNIRPVVAIGPTHWSHAAMSI
jgi:hypothetical protein